MDETFGEALERLRREAAELGANHLVDQVDALGRDVGERRDQALRAQGVVPGVFEALRPCPVCGTPVNRDFVDADGGDHWTMHRRV